MSAAAPEKRRLLMTAGDTEFEIEVAEDIDLDDRFVALDIETGERIVINGWLCSFEDLT